MSSATTEPKVRELVDGVQVGKGATLESVITAFHRARAEVAGLFAVVGVDPTKTRESARELGINRGLTWRLTRMVQESNPTLAASDVPGVQSMAKFLDACRQRGAPESAIDSAQAALNEFESALAACSGDRKTLAMLMANHGDAKATAEAEKVRRKLFEGACGVWGVQARVRFVTVFVFPSPDDPTTMDAGHVNGFVGFRRLRPQAVPLSYEAVHKSTGEAIKFTKEPLDPAGPGEGRAQVYKRFSNPAEPDIQMVESGGYRRFELASGPVGNEGLTTCVFGTRLRRLYDRYSESPETAGFMVLLNIPVERVMFDLFIHKDIDAPEIPRTLLLDRLLFPHVNNEADFTRQSLPLAERPQRLPAGIEGTLCPYMSWYSSMISDVAAKIDVPIEQFTGSRFEMMYPPITATLRREFNLACPPRG
ncbi:MAG: hypothetical protein U0573_13135 [Phycisphaerales bacterium]|nr:hypothetical protein [Planctomycetota bacterium]